MTCIFCTGNMVDKLTTFTVDFEECTIIVKDVPSQVCKRCGEVTYSGVVTRRIEEIVKNARSIIKGFVVLDYRDNAA